MANILFRRSESGRRDRARKYRVSVDGAEVGVLGRGDEFELDVAVGVHDVDVRIDWKHHRLQVSVEADEAVIIDCAPRGSLSALIDMLPGRPWVTVQVQR